MVQCYIGWAPRLLRVPVQAPWLCRARCYTQQLGKVLGLASWPGGPSNVFYTFQVSVATLPEGVGLGGYALQLGENTFFSPFWAGLRMCSTTSGHL